MPKRAMTDLLDRLEMNSQQFSKSYNSANDLLNAAVAEAFPWVLGLPVVRSRIPQAMRGFIPRGVPVTPDKVERLATQLVAILAATYATPPANDIAPPPEDPAQAARLQANILNFKEQ